MHNTTSRRPSAWSSGSRTSSAKTILRTAARPFGRSAEGRGRLRNQLRVNKVILELAAKRRQVYLFERRALHLAEDAVAHDHLINLNTGRDLTIQPRAIRLVSQVARRDGGALPGPSRSAGHDARNRRQVRGLQADARPADAQLPAAGDFPIALGELRESSPRRSRTRCWRRSAPAPPFRSWKGCCRRQELDRLIPNSTATSRT